MFFIFFRFSIVYFVFTVIFYSVFMRNVLLFYLYRIRYVYFIRNGYLHYEGIKRKDSRDISLKTLTRFTGVRRSYFLCRCSRWRS